MRSSGVCCCLLLYYILLLILIIDYVVVYTIQLTYDLSSRHANCDQQVPENFYVSNVLLLLYISYNLFQNNCNSCQSSLKPLTQ